MDKCIIHWIFFHQVIQKYAYKQEVDGDETDEDDKEDGDRSPSPSPAKKKKKNVISDQSEEGKTALLRLCYIIFRAYQEGLTSFTHQLSAIATNP